MDLRQGGDERLGHPVGEELLVGIARQVLERQHGDRLDTARREHRGLDLNRAGGRGPLALRPRLDRPQRGLHPGGRSGTPRGVLLEQGDQKGIERRGDPDAERAGARRRQVKDLVHERRIERGAERELSGRHFVEQNAERVEIAPLVALLSEELLRGHVGERADDLSEIGQAPRLGR